MDIHMMELFFEIHSDLPREGPGDSQSTQKALSLMKDLPDQPLILDIGCGPGKQTMDLIEMTKGRIIAIDNHKPYVDRLNETASKAGLESRIHAFYGDMTRPGFKEESFDVIWSEGAIYIMGFENGLKTWKPLLKKKGYIAVTECTWLKPNPPQEVKRFFDEGYPGMLDIEANLRVIKGTGYYIADHFTLPEHAWWNDYYHPLEDRIDRLKEKYKDNEEALQLLEGEGVEIELYRKYSDYYGYVFYVIRLC